MIEEISQRAVSRRVLERRLAQTGLGILQALRGSTMTIADAEHDLFNLDTYRTARRRRLGRDLIEFLEWGMELDDVSNLAPEGLEESFRSMETLLLRVIARSLGGGHSRRRV
jgi:hypothetical protein